MASQHRRPRSAGSRVAGIRPPALATAALTSVALLSQSANAAESADGRPSLEEVEKKVDDLYRQAESATEKNTSAKEKTTKQRTRVDGLLDEVAPQRTRKPDEARTEPGRRAAARYRTGASAPDTAAFPLADTRQDHVGRNGLTDRPTDRPAGRRQGAVDDYVAERPATTKTRQVTRETAESRATPTDPQHGLRTAKAAVQKKLGDARELLSLLAAQEQARLASIERQQQEEAARAAAELARRQAAARQAAQQSAQQTAWQESGGGSPGTESPGTPSPAASWAGMDSPDSAAPPAVSAAGPVSPSMASTGSGTSAAAAAPAASPTGTVHSSGSTADASYATKAEKALAFARAQIGKPCVWGATGPGSYDSSGLTQAAWKAAAVTLPRSAHDQANAGVTVSPADARPGDLVFFYGDLSHVGICIGNGMMIHSPKPGAYVREESIHYDAESGVHRVVRPA
ncbi:cell wall-associated NlpC family hydrolase [Streptomyces achromogenes]|uniref:C40 family peptidase n=1 Tax=Streptomyces achromogenes TaxID=67255 RepID=UPI0027887FD9|nr:C40 family peptidase [Streptomyces achromogenes]MDQ0832937.1 cell wall-associated NlpC family hydrolase [Streptomyces achromogenes]